MPAISCACAGAPTAVLASILVAALAAVPAAVLSRRPNRRPDRRHPPPQALEDLYTHYDGTVRNAAGGIVQVGPRGAAVGGSSGTLRQRRAMLGCV